MNNVKFVIQDTDNNIWMAVERLLLVVDNGCENCQGDARFVVRNITPSVRPECYYCGPCVKAQRDNADMVAEQWFKIALAD